MRRQVIVIDKKYIYISLYVHATIFSPSLYIESSKRKVDLPTSNTEEINAAFSTVVFPKKRTGDDLYKLSKKKQRQTKRDEDYYIPYSAPDKHTEDG